MGRVLDDEADQRTRAIRTEAAMHGIVCYLRMHPNSADSLRGVRLWLHALADEFSDDVVTLALEKLMEQGEVEARHVLGGAVVYGRGRALRGEM